MPERERTRGSGTMLMMIVIGAVIILLPLTLGVVTAVQANARARAAADLGAIAAADYYLAGHTPEEACGVGARIVRANRAAPAGCSIASSGRTVISTTVTARLPILGERTTGGLSRAGPVLTG